MLDVLDISTNPYKCDFPLLSKNPDLVFLDSAATAQRPATVLEAQTRFYEEMNANPLRGLYALSVAATEAISSVRAKIANRLGASRPEEVIFCRNASEGLNLIARSLGSFALEAGDEVVISIMEHHSNLIPWQQICKERGAKLSYIYPEKDGTITPEIVQKSLSNKTKIVSVTHVSNVLGIQNDIAMIARAAHERGAYMVVDAAQSVPHLAVDVEELGCDFLAFSGHKVLGPMGVGAIWGKYELLDKLPVFLTGGEMIDSVSEQDAVWAPLPEKFEAGTQDAAGIYALGAAFDYLDSQHEDQLFARERKLSSYLVEQLQKLDFVEILGPVEPERHIGVASFVMGDIHPHDISSILDNYSIAIRAGHHCAEPLLRWMGYQSTARASIAFYNDTHDIDALCEGLTRVWSLFHGN